MIRAILFDLDETLFDHRAAVAHAVTAWTADRSPFHPLLAEGPGLWLRLEDVHLPAWHRGECSFGEQRRRRLRDYCRRRRAAGPGRPGRRVRASSWTCTSRRGPPSPTPPSVVNRLAGTGVTLGVLTNGQPVQQEAKLRRLGLLDRLDPVLTPDALGGNFKPSAEVYTAAACQAGPGPGRGGPGGRQPQPGRDRADAGGHARRLAGPLAGRSPPRPGWWRSAPCWSCSALLPELASVRPLALVSSPARVQRTAAATLRARRGWVRASVLSATWSTVPTRSRRAMAGSVTASMRARA